MSTFNAGNAAVNDVKFGNTTASEVYQGNTKVWPNAPTAPDYTGIVAAFNTTTLPTGWVLCDGLNGTRDLRDRFVVGAGSSYSLGATGGANAVTLSESELPLHSHNATGSASGSHTHNTSLGGGGHTHAMTVGSAGHNHNYTGHGNSGLFANQFANYVAVQATAANFTGAATEGAHTDLVSSATGGHTHNADPSGTHNHNSSMSINSAGSSGAHENRPPYYALVYAQATAAATGTTSVGMIAMTEGTVPTGWIACDATNLPDLRDKFVVGSQSTYALGATGGSNTVTLTTTTMALHNHSVSVTADNVGHTHVTNSPTHTHTVGFTAHASHVHDYDFQSSTTITVGGTGATIRATPTTQTAVATGSAAHSVTWGSTNVPHGHVSSNSGPGHNHTFTGGNAGSGGAHENRPLYRAATYMRKTGTQDIPSGTIVMFNGSTIPTGWTEATNYRDRFPVGAGLTYAVGAVGGANAVTLTNTEMPLHTHNGGSNGTEGFHNEHAIVDTNYTHTHTGSAAHNTNHGHALTTSNTTTTKLGGNVINAMVATLTRTTRTGTDVHGHNTATNASNADHTHSLTASANHSHTTNLGNAGSGFSHENRPPYTALTFIIKT